MRTALDTLPVDVIVLVRRPSSSNIVAFSASGPARKVASSVGGELASAVHALSGPDIHFIDDSTQPELNELMDRAREMMFPQKECT